MNISQGRQLDVTVYTDPLCCWSWAFQPQLDTIRNTLSAEARFRYRMGGLIPSWNNFHDEVNSVIRPVQMGPVWMHAGQIANMPIHHQLWMQDPPASSYPACIAVKCAELQSAEFADTYLQMLRQECMGKGKNIAKQSVLFAVAEQLSMQNPGFNTETFISDFNNDAGLDAFRSDLDEVRKYRITRFPALIVRTQDAGAIIISGYRPAEEVLQAIDKMNRPDTTPVE